MKRSVFLKNAKKVLAAFFAFTFSLQPVSFAARQKSTAQVPAVRRPLAQDLRLAGISAVLTGSSRAESRLVARFDPDGVFPPESAARLYVPASKTADRRDRNVLVADGVPAFKTLDELDQLAAAFVEQKGALSLTTNPAIVMGVIKSGALNEDIKRLAEEKKSTFEIYQELTTIVTVRLAGIFSGVRETVPTEGKVSYEAPASYARAEELVGAFEYIQAVLGDRPGSFFAKAPNLKVEGPKAVREAVRKGLDLNITLLFDVPQTLDNLEAIIYGLDDRVKDLRDLGQSETDISADISKLQYVLSVFVSRWDSLIDKKIDAVNTPGNPQAEQLAILRGKTGIAITKFVNRIIDTVLHGVPFTDPQNLVSESDRARIQDLTEKFSILKTFGVQAPRLLVASTGTKDAAYHKLLYVLSFLGPNLNTMPLPTVAAYNDYIKTLSEEVIAALRARDIINEPIPAIPFKADNIAQQLEAIVNPGTIATITPDEILRQVQDIVLNADSTTLAGLADKLRNDGAKIFLDAENDALKFIDETAAPFRAEARLAEAAVAVPDLKDRKLSASIRALVADIPKDDFVTTREVIDLRAGRGLKLNGALVVSAKSAFVDGLLAGLPRIAGKQPAVIVLDPEDPQLPKQLDAIAGFNKKLPKNRQVLAANSPAEAFKLLDSRVAPNTPIYGYLSVGDAEALKRQWDKIGFLARIISRDQVDTIAGRALAGVVQRLREIFAVSKSA